MLSNDGEDWWDNARQRMEATGVELTWAVFRNELLEKYFNEDVCGKKEIEFHELNQENMTLADIL